MDRGIYENQSHACGMGWVDTSRVTGISFVRSEVKLAQIKDGTSNTYLIGEKHVDPRSYLDGTDAGDDWGMYNGQQDDNVRSTFCFKAPNGDCDPNGNIDYTPKQDTPGAGGLQEFVHSFGSAHPGGCNMGLCDGSVRSISYEIDQEVHRRHGSRKDGRFAGEL